MAPANGNTHVVAPTAPADAGQAAPNNGAGQGNEPSLTPMQEFGNRLKALRHLISDLAMPRLKEVFRTRCKSFVKDYPECTDLESCLEEYRVGIYDNKKRLMVVNLCNKMWGKECLPAIEKQIMEKLKLQYEDWQVDLSRAPKTRRSGGCVRNITGRLRNTLIADRFRCVYKIGWNRFLIIVKS